MTAFLALYRGATISAAELVAVSADNNIVKDFAARLITEPDTEDAATPAEPGLHLVDGEQAVITRKEKGFPPTKAENPNQDWR